MGKLTDGDQFAFLISCIRHSNNGKVNFDEVAKECSIVTKAAAAKRYERLMKAHGIHQGSTGISASATPQKSKVRKSFDDDSDHDVGTPTKKRKRAPAKKAAPATPKTETEDDDELAGAGDNDDKEQSAVKSEPSGDDDDE